MYLLELADTNSHFRRIVSPPSIASKMGAVDMDRVKRAELWASSFGDPGDDFCEIRIWYTEDDVAPDITIKIPGY